MPYSLTAIELCGGNEKKTAHTIKCKKRVGLWVGDGGDYGCKLIRRTKPQMGDAKGWGEVGWRRIMGTHIKSTFMHLCVQRKVKI